jgi:biopolymer transport protein TolR
MRKSDRSQINEINVVPYVDVMLVLLVVFMVTAPLLVQGIKIDLPETTASVLEESELEELTLTIDKKGQFFIELNLIKINHFPLIL